MMEKSYPMIDRRLEKIEHLISIEKYDGAEKEIREIIAQNPNIASLHTILARILCHKKDWEEAEKECRTALQIYAHSIEALLLLGKIHMDKGQHCAAEKIFLDALHLAPDSMGAYHIYAVLMYKTGHLKKAQALIEIALRLDPENENAHAVMALIMAERKYFASAHRHSHKSVKLAPEDEMSHYSLGTTYYFSHRPFKSRHHFREALRRDPNDKEIEDMFLTADRATRVIYLPFYHISLLLNRLPGSQFTLWGIFVVCIYILPMLGVSRNTISIIAIGYIAFALYT